MSRNNQKHQYTPETDAVIRECYQNPAMYRLKSVKVAAKKLGWTTGIIKQRAKLLGVSRVKESPWSNAELMILDRWAHQHPRNIQLKLRAAGYARSEGAIAQRRSLLGLLSCVDGYSARELAGLFGIDSHVIARWLDNKWLKAERYAGDRLDGRNKWFIRHKAVYEFVLEHPNEYDLGKLNKVWFLDLITQGKTIWTGTYQSVAASATGSVPAEPSPENPAGR